MDQTEEQKAAMAAAVANAEAKRAEEATKRQEIAVDLLQRSEMLTESSPSDVISQIIKESSEAGLSDFDTERTAKAIAKRTKVSIITIRKMAHGQSKKRGGANEDFGRRLALSTLNRFYRGGDYIVRVAGDFWIYNDKYWERKDDEQIGHNINLTMLEMDNPDGIAHSSAISQALQLMRVVSAKPDDVFSLMKEARPIINTATGELWLAPDGTPLLKPHSHDSYQTSCLDVAYDPYASCPVYDKTIREIFLNSKQPDDMVRHWHEVTGYAIQPRRHIAAWFLLKGMGENGKSKLVETLAEHLIGYSGVSTMKLATLDDDKFAMSGLVGKLVVLEEDMNKSAHLPDGILKSISERKVLQAEFKGRDRFSFICRALPMMMSNHFPKTMDLSHGMLRRANVIPFRRIFDISKGEADVTLFPYVWTNEMPGVLNRAIQGLQRLLARGRFLPPLDCVAALDSWSCAANPVKAFIRNNLEAGDEHRTSWSQVWESFKRWCEDENMRFTMGRNNVKREFVSIGVKFSKIDGYDFVKGYRFATTRRTVDDDESD